MSGIGNYGIKRPADVSPNDIEVVVVYTPNRNLGNQQVVTKFIGTEVITPIFDVDSTGNSTLEILGGLYNLELPSQTVWVHDLNKLVRLNDDGTKLPNTFNIITTSFLAEPVSENNTNSSQKTVKYSFNDGGSLLYCTVTPNVAPSFKPTARPFIGFKGQNVILTNTSFNPIVKEVELVDYDLESIAIGLFGDQTKSIDDGIYTLYDFDGNIYTQFDLYEIRDVADEPLYEVRTRRDVIDSNKTLGNITNG